MSRQTVALTGVSKQFVTGPETITVLDSLELLVSGGESVAVTGPSGSGKTTLLNIIGGLDTPDSGKVIIDDVDMSAIDETERSVMRGKNIGFVFQFHYLLRDFTAIENVMLPMHMQGASRRESNTRAAELLAAVGLAQRHSHYPHQLSGGERQRVALARALINDPAVLLADEPTGNLDPDHSKSVEDLVFAISERLGKNLVIVSHDSRIADRASRHLVLADGALRPA